MSVIDSPTTPTPLKYSPSLWLDATDTSTITSSGGSVSAWRDKSGNGNHSVQATGSLQPSIGTGINGLQTIDGDGTNYLNIPDSAVLRATMGLQITYMIFVVYRPTAFGASTNAVYNFTDDANSGLHLLRARSIDTAVESWMSGGSFNPTIGGGGTIPVNILCRAYRFGTGASQANFLINGSSTDLTRSVSGLTYTSLDIDIMSRNGTVPFNGSIGEMIFYNTYNADALTDVLYYLSNKWGIIALS